jgi:hypothetical protein
MASVLAGCAGADSDTDIHDAAAEGTLSVNLVGSAASGTIYRLRDATITVTGPGTTTVFHTEDDPNRTSLSSNVVVGDYSAFVDPGWRLERIVGNSVTTVTGELISDNPAQFTVSSHQRTTVPLRFRVDAGEVDMDQGYDIVLDIDEVNNAHGLVISNFLSGTASPGLEVFPLDASGDATATRTIGGASTELVSPRGIVVVGSEIVVADQGANAIDVFALTASGDVAPLRRIAGDQTQLSTPSSVLVFNGEIYVGQQDAPLLVFPLTADGDVAPTRSLNGIGRGQYVAIDNGELYVNDADGPIRVFSVTATGNDLPVRVINGPHTGLQEPTGLLIHDGELFVSDGLNNTISVFAETASGDTAPLRVISTTPGSVSFLDQLAISGNELFVASFSTNSVEVFPVTANGDVVPTRVISGPSTQFAGPVGVFVF